MDVATVDAHHDRHLRWCRIVEIVRIAVAELVVGEFGVESISEVRHGPEQLAAMHLTADREHLCEQPGRGPVGHVSCEFGLNE